LAAKASDRAPGPTLTAAVLLIGDTRISTPLSSAALASLAALDLRAAVQDLKVPAWFVNGQFDQLRLHESAFRRWAPEARFTVVPRASHLVTAMRPDTFNAVLDDALVTMTADAESGQPARA